MKKYNLFSFIIILIVVISLGLTVSDNRNFELSKNLSIYQSILRELNLAFVDDINPKELINGSIESMLKTLDPYTTYIPEEELDNLRTMTTGEYAGIGAIIGKKEKHVIIIEPYKGFPADKFGLKAGDMLVEINGENVIDKETEDVSKLLKGKAESNVKVKIKRPYQDDENTYKTIEITRKNIQLKCVPYYGIVGDNIGYIDLINFTEKAEHAVKNAIVELKSLGAQSLILDVRSNPGGLLTQAIKVTNLFVDKGTTIVSTKGKHSKWQNSYKASSYPVDKDIPLVILVNESSASASEILAGTIQDLDRGVIIGNRTFGKGLVQQTRPLAFDAQLKLTTAYYFLPSGRSIQKLDFRNKDKNGDPKKRIPESLVSEYQTKNGRKVYDGGGINPDIVIENPTFSKLSSYLSRKYMIFDFATQYASTHFSIEPAKQFFISDEDFNNFKSFVLSKDNLDYSSESRKALDAFKKLVKNEKIYEKVKDDLTNIEQKITLNISEDLDEFREEIKKLISYEITKRYYYQEGAIENTLSNDVVLQKAIQVLKDNQLYTNTLSSSLVHVE